MSEKTIVVFRLWPKEGRVVALFPDIDGDGHCSSYKPGGYNNAVDYKFVVGKTRPATPNEYQSLLNELRQAGYNLEVRKRWNWGMAFRG